MVCPLTIFAAVSSFCKSGIVSVLKSACVCLSSPPSILVLYFWRGGVTVSACNIEVRKSGALVSDAAHFGGAEGTAGNLFLDSFSCQLITITCAVSLGVASTSN